MTVFKMPRVRTTSLTTLTWINTCHWTWCTKRYWHVFLVASPVTKQWGRLVSIQGDGLLPAICRQDAPSRITNRYRSFLEILLTVYLIRLVSDLHLWTQHSFISSLRHNYECSIGTNSIYAGKDIFGGFDNQPSAMNNQVIVIILLTDK